MQEDKQDAEKVEVWVGSWDPDGVFNGQIVRFAGEEVGNYRVLTGQFPRSDDRGIDHTLYRTPDGCYRAYVEHWSRHSGEGGFALLLPSIDADDFDADIDFPIKFETYSEEEARAQYPRIFAAMGDPNVVELD